MGSGKVESDAENTTRAAGGGEGKGEGWYTYCCTTFRLCIKTAVSSLTRCGRLPVSCSWTTTASTMSSLMESKSISLEEGSSSSDSIEERWAGGEGGGVYFIESSRRFAWGPDREGSSSSSSSWVCARFNFLLGCVACSLEGVGEAMLAGDVSRAAAAAAATDARCCAAAALSARVTGTWMPSEGNESDLRRVL